MSSDGSSRGDPHDGADTGAPGDEFEEMRSRPAGRRGRRVIPTLAVLGVVAVVALVAGGLWVRTRIDPPGGPGRPITVDLQRGTTGNTLASILATKGVIRSPRLFRLWAKLNGGLSFQAGRYVFRQHESYDDALAVLHRGAKEEVLRLTIPEGFTLEQTADRVGQLPGRSAARFLSVARSGSIRSKYLPAAATTPEGTVWPSTYELKPTDDEAAIYQRMVTAFDNEGDGIGLGQAQSRLGLSPYDVIIVASMVEREARVPDDRAMVSRVIYNRLKRGIPLGIDATLRYALKKPRDPLRRSELKLQSPYNTRLVKGLPPTPIASPGDSTLRAALQPADGQWLFYVLADDQGHHVFVNTDAEFERAVVVCKQKGLGC